MVCVFCFLPLYIGIYHCAYFVVNFNVFFVVKHFELPRLVAGTSKCSRAQNRWKIHENFYSPVHSAPRTWPKAIRNANMINSNTYEIKILLLLHRCAYFFYTYVQFARFSDDFVRFWDRWLEQSNMGTTRNANNILPLLLSNHIYVFCCPRPKP